MGFMDKLRTQIQDIQGQLDTKAKQFQNKAFKDATMAICALVATADGVIEPSEKSKIALCIGNTQALKSFKAVELKQLFDEFCDQINADTDFGRLNAMEAVAKLKGKTDQAETAVQIALIIANADGVFDPTEKVQVTNICRALGLDATSYVS